MTYTEQLIEQTLRDGPFYLEVEEDQVLSKISSRLSLSLEQESALELCLASSPVMTIQGVIGSGKTRLVQVLAETLQLTQQKFLLLSQYPESLSIYQDNLGVVFSLGQTIDYSTWLQEIYLGHVEMDYLPLGSLSDPLLQQLRSPRKLEKWVKILQQSPSQENIVSQLEIEFPNSSLVRLEILSYRLKELFVFLREQLGLYQSSGRLSPQGVGMLVESIGDNLDIPILGTIKEFFALEDNHPLRHQIYSCIIVEESHTLTEDQILELAEITNRLILVGDSPLLDSRENAFYGLYNRLLPNYHYHLSQQYRLHPELAQPIFRVLYRDPVDTFPPEERLDLPQLRGHLIWQDIRTQAENGVNPIEGKKLLRFLEQFQNVPPELIGILTFTSSQKDYLENNYPPSLPRIFIGDVQDWRGQQRSLVLVSCVDRSAVRTQPDFALSLTRGLDYLIFFGNSQVWERSNSPLGYLLQQPELLRDREVSFR